MSTPSSPAFRRVLTGTPLTGKSSRLLRDYIHCVRKEHVSPQRILLLSFFSANAQALRHKLHEVAQFLPNVTTLQHFQLTLLTEYVDTVGLDTPLEEISPAARALIIARAWADVGGALWREFHEAPGAVGELTRVVDWISQNRRRFTLTPGELSEHELARVYAHYIELCEQHRVLTFQESSLRCLDLLAEEGIARGVHNRFPVVMVDDLHQARPDQLALIERLCGPDTRFTGTAWFQENPASPELRHVQEFLQSCEQVETLDRPAPDLNPAITSLIGRVIQMPGARQPIASPIMLAAGASAVEDEAELVARAVADQLARDRALKPSEIAIVAADAGLLPFARRVLARYGLVSPQPPPARHNPLIYAGILALQWLAQGADAEIDSELLALPYVAIDPIDRAALERAAKEHEKSILELEGTEMPSLVAPEATTACLGRVREALGKLNKESPLRPQLFQLIRDLGGIAWAWDNSAFGRAQRDEWARTFSNWLVAISDLEGTARSVNTPFEEWIDLLDGLADELTQTETRPEEIQFLDSLHANGSHARRAFVVGLSENACPIQNTPLQLISEKELPALFADGRRVVLPALKDHAAWIEREARKLAVLLSRGTEHLQVSVSQFTAGGEAQLPSPFFERMLADEGEIDKDGQIQLTHPVFWSKASEFAPLSVGGPPRHSGSAPEPAKVLNNHTFSATQIRMYLTCPLQFFLAHVLNIETEEEDTPRRGSLIHEVLCAALGDGTCREVDLSRGKQAPWIGDAPRLKERAQKALDAAWTGQATDLPGGGHYTPSAEWSVGFGPDLQRRAVHLWAQDALAAWAEFESGGLPDAEVRRPILLEVPFRFEIEGLPIAGRIDRIDQIKTAAGTFYEVIDYKTGSSGKYALNAQMQKFLPEGDKRPSDYQLPLYALALMAGVRRIQGAPRALHYMNIGSIVEKDNGSYTAESCRTIQVTKGKLDYRRGELPISALEKQMPHAIASTLNSMSSTPCAATPTYGACNYCAFTSVCDQGKATGGEA
ncbi:MAG: PD-(D/E)XK nuclease family protein [Chloroflexi bacterium]|nr:PD-(D/E)XK nuclease family protein [Chloroflexota bacterium]